MRLEVLLSQSNGGIRTPDPLFTKPLGLYAVRPSSGPLT
jgi:hypothetical protein